jgi:hypothetical protein
MVYNFFRERCFVYQYSGVYSALATLLSDSHWPHSVITLLDFESKSGSAPSLLAPWAKLYRTAHGKGMDLGTADQHQQSS